MSGEHRGEVARDVLATNHVRRRGEHVICRPDRCAFNALVQTKQSNVSRRGSVPGAGKQVAEHASDVITLRRDSGYGDADTTDFGDECARPIEDVNPWMLREPEVRNSSAFVISGDDINRYSTIRYLT